MPRKVDPGQIAVGKGLAPEGTVEDNSFRYPERDADPLRVHIHDPSRAHMASSIGIVDEADCYVSDEVEGALQELCGGYSSGRLNGLIRGGLFNEVKAGLPTAGTTLTLETTTEIAIGAHVFDASGLVIVLPAVDTDYFVYCDTYSSSPDYRTLQYTTTAPPEVESDSPEIEQVMLAKITVAGGVITAYQDARFFVRNLDRKVLYSSRQGENVDAWSEGCFATLNAAMFWMEFYGDTGTSEEEKGTLLVRGVHELDSTLVIPSDHVEFVGDGEGIIRAKTGFVGTRLIELPNTSLQNDVSFKNITFQTEVAGLSCIYSDSVLDLGKISIDSCHIDIYGGVLFESGVVLRSTGPYGVTQFWMNNTIVRASITGLELRQSRRAQVLGCTFTGPGSAAAGVTGIWAWEGNDLLISDCTLEDWSDAILLDDSLTDIRIETTRIQGSAFGIKYNGGSIGTDILISDCIIELDDDNADSGIWMVDVKRVGISNTHISSLRTSWGAGHHPYGIAVGPLTGSATTGRLDLQITGCYIQGFLNQTDNESGNGILVGGGPTTYAVNTTITGNSLVGNNISVEHAVSTTITGNSVDMSEGVGSSAATFSLVELRGVTDCTVSGNSVRGRGKATEGIYVSESSVDQPSSNVTITGNTVRGVFTTGIELENTVSDFTVADNTIDLFIPGNPVVYGAALISLSNSTATEVGPSRGAITGNNGYRAQNGILLRGSEINQGSDVLVANNVMQNIANDAAFVVDSFSGSLGIGIEWYKNCTVQGNQLNEIGAAPEIALVTVYPRPIMAVDCDVLTIDSNKITGCVSVGAGDVEGISVLLGNDTVGVQRTNFNITGNVIQTVADDDKRGIHFKVMQLVGLTEMYARNIVIAENTITRVSGTLSEAILVDVSLCGDIFDLTVRNNNLSHFKYTGIYLKVWGSVKTTAQRLDSFRVVGNTLHGADPGAGATQIGVWLYGTNSTTADVTVADGSFFSNKIIGGYDEGFRIQLDAVAAAGAAELKTGNIYVNDNEISELYNSSGTLGTKGIYVRGAGMAADHSSTGFHTFQISRNSMKNWYSGAIAHGIYWATSGVPVTQLSIEDNVIEGMGTDGQQSILFFAGDASLDSGLGVWKEISISGNTVTAYTGTAVIRDAVVMDFTDVRVANLKVVGNTLNAQSTGSTIGEAFEIVHDYANHSGNQILQVIIDGNLMTGGVRLHAPGTSVKDWSVSNNSITCPTGSGGQNPIRFDVEGAGQQPVLENLRVQGNSLKGGTAGCLIAPINSVQHVKDVVIKNNLVSDGEYAGLVFDASGSNAVVSVSDVSITGNQISLTPHGVVTHFYTAELEGLTIGNNEFRALAEQAIVCLMGGDVGGTKDSATNVLIDGNDILNVTATSGEPVIEVGMHVPAPASPGDVKNISVSRNTIAQVGPVDNGVVFVSVEMAGWTDSENIRVSDNNLMGDPDDENQMNTGIYLAVSPTAMNTTVDGNQIYAASRRGIQLATGGECRLWSVSNNNIVQSSASVTQGIYLNITGSDIVQWRVNDNIVRHVPASAALDNSEGIYLKQGSGTGNWQQGTVSRNNVDQYGYGISLLANDPTAVIREVAVDDNLIGGFVHVSGQTVTGALRYGIRILATEFTIIFAIPIVGESILGLSVSRNQINSPAIGTGSSAGSGILVVGGLLQNSEICRQIAINDNMVYQTSSSYNCKSSGIIAGLYSQNAMSQVSLDRNHVRNMTEYGIFSYGRLAAGFTGAVKQWSCCDNQVQGNQTILSSITSNADPFCNIGVAFPGTGGGVINSEAEDVFVCRNNSSVNLAGDHINYYFGVSKDDGVGPSSGWWVTDNAARGGTNAYSVVTDGTSGHGTAWGPEFGTWSGQGEPTRKTVHDNRCETTGNADDWNGGASWTGIAGDNTHNNENY